MGHDWPWKVYIMCIGPQLLQLELHVTGLKVHRSSMHTVVHVAHAGVVASAEWAGKMHNITASHHGMRDRSLEKSH